MASVEPLPGSPRPSASTRKFIELAVNIPEHEPQVGQAFSSMRSRSVSLTLSFAESAMAEMRSSLRTVPSTRVVRPPSIGPPETNTVGMFRRSAASSIPGVILSQLETHTSTSAQCALTMYSTESAISSREGSEYSIPPWPIAMPSSTAMVLNSRGMPPASCTAAETMRPTGCRWV